MPRIYGRGGLINKRVLRCIKVTRSNIGRSGGKYRGLRPPIRLTELIIVLVNIIGHRLGCIWRFPYAKCSRGQDWHCRSGLWLTCLRRSVVAHGRVDWLRLHLKPLFLLPAAFNAGKFLSLYSIYAIFPPTKSRQ